MTKKDIDSTLFKTGLAKYVQKTLETATKLKISSYIFLKNQNQCAERI